MTTPYRGHKTNDKQYSNVIDDSLAEKSGLREGDEIIQVGRVNVQDLTLGQVHELLARCGNKIEMFIVRSEDVDKHSIKSFVSSVRGERRVWREIVSSSYNYAVIFMFLRIVLMQSNVFFQEFAPLKEHFPLSSCPENNYDENNLFLEECEYSDEF
ncbi:PDZ domain-containing protein [Trichonephila clavata]|uniref:PDZ domain-containing protein n=1 Tax=Trichonephila clavata TaxID=2740835 RepID=A0A8X6K7A5_TRICU|nr:PDZ domain-containing protein [Trichonephila clavata]